MTPGHLLRPCPDDWEVTLPFGAITAGYTVDHPHQGQDWAPEGRSGLGEPVYAVDEGTATEATRYGYSERGNYVRLRHADGSETGYAHCSRLVVQPGEHVDAGQVIALAGATGKATAVHVHLERWVRVYSGDWYELVRVDPAAYIGEERDG